MTSLASINFEVPAGSSVVVNVAAAGTISFANGQVTLNNLVNQDPTQAPFASHVLFNLSQASEVDVSAYGFAGALLAPQAQANINSAHVDGTVVARGLTDTGELYEYFTGNIGGATCPNASPCTSDHDCQDPLLPVCDLLPDAEHGQCVQCMDDQECPTSEPICDLGMHACVSRCREDGPPSCPDPSFPACNSIGRLGGVCTQCSQSNTSQCTGDMPYCDALLPACASAASTTTIAREQQICDPVSRSCSDRLLGSVDAGASVGPNETSNEPIGTVAGGGCSVAVGGDGHGLFFLALVGAVFWSARRRRARR